MYKIACCDDDFAFLNDLEQTCSDIFRANNISYEFTRFSSFEDLYQSCISTPAAYDLLILDIYIDLERDTTGIAFAKKLRDLEINASILFISSSPDYILDGYDVQALRYILKPVDPDLLKRTLLNDYNKRLKSQRLILTKGSKITSVFYQDILYIESYQHNCLIHTKDEILTYNIRLEKLLLQLPSDTFVRCHQSFIVNLSCIILIRRYEAVLTNHENVSISKSYYKQVQNDFLQFLRQDN